MNEETIEQIVPDTGHGAGAIPDAPDQRDFKWGQQIGDSTVPFDWEKGYDVEQELRQLLQDPEFKLFVNDQDGSSSCGGQAISKKGEVLSAFFNKKYVRKSAKFPYCQVFAPGGGSGAKMLFDIYHSQGMGQEVDTPSYDAGMPPGEAFMERVGDITETARNNAKNDKSLAYAQVRIDIDSLAQAIRDTKGVIIGISGTNNGTWRTAFPKPPENLRDVWNHWVYAGKAKIIDGKKYIGFLNSWSEETGDKGWQWIGEDYMAKGVFVLWTFVYDTHDGQGEFTRTLRVRSRGDDVKKLQNLLGMKLVDGIFGNDTLFHVKQFQHSWGLVADGIVGPITQAKLLEANK